MDQDKHVEVRICREDSAPGTVLQSLSSSSYCLTIPSACLNIHLTTCNRRKNIKVANDPSVFTFTEKAPTRAIMKKKFTSCYFCLPVVNETEERKQQEENIRVPNDPSVFTLTEKAPTRAIMKKTFSCYYCLLPAFIKT